MADEEKPKDEAKVEAGKRGGRARAEVLSPEERREIARRAATARWGEVANATKRRATHSGVLEFGGMRIPVAVLDDGTRVISETGITNALLGTRSGASRRARLASLEQGTPVPLFLAPGNLKPFISEELVVRTLKPIIYEQSGRPVVGFSAEILPEACEVWLLAREADALFPRQMDKAMKAEILLRGLARVGIAALIDEVTGYQEIRDRDALRAILDRYLLAEHAKWAKRFPDEFYKEIFRLKNWPWRGMKVNRPQVVAKYTNDIVWGRLAPNILQELRERNPMDERGHRRVRHHQFLTAEVGHPALQSHLTGVIALMRASTTWDEFKKILQRAYPKVNSTLPIPFKDHSN